MLWLFRKLWFFKNVFEQYKHFLEHIFWNMTIFLNFEEFPKTKTIFLKIVYNYLKFEEILETQIVS